MAHDRRRTRMETRYAELIMGLVESFVYGWHAMHAPAANQISSQFQMLLLLEGGAFEIGFAFFVVGIALAFFAYSRFNRARLVINALMVILWVIIVWLFLLYKQPGIPLGIGVIFGVAHAIVCATILFQEKHLNGCHESNPDSAVG